MSPIELYCEMPASMCKSNGVGGIMQDFGNFEGSDSSSLNSKIVFNSRNMYTCGFSRTIKFSKVEEWAAMGVCSSQQVTRYRLIKLK